MFLALAEANATLGLWMQKVALQLLAQSRFATSSGPDADSWGAQFGFLRLGAVSATGFVTFAGAPGSTVAIGQQVQTTDGAETFGVVIDTTNVSYSPSTNIGPQGGYIIGTIGTLAVPVIAAIPGNAGNVQAGTITVILGAPLGATISGVNTVNNPSGFLNGLDAESDAAYKARFPAYLAGLARADKAAIISAIQATQQGLVYELIENQNAIGSALPYEDVSLYFDRPGGFANPTLVPSPGMVLVVIDDGSGAPSLNLIDQVVAAIDAVRGMAIRFIVMGPVIVTANIVLTLAMQSGYTHTAGAALAQVAVQNWLNSRPLGTLVVPLTRLPQVIYDAVPGVANVTGVTINGQPADLLLNFVEVVKAGSVEID